MNTNKLAVTLINCACAVIGAILYICAGAIWVPAFIVMKIAEALKEAGEYILGCRLDYTPVEEVEEEEEPEAEEYEDVYDVAID